MKPWQCLESVDPDVHRMVNAELGRQTEGLELIASENFVSSVVLQSMANVLCNKYAEGRPGKRYYGGCEYVDELENLAIQRACEIFGAKFANVQPHSGAQANAAALLALAKPGDTILGMNLSHGGHLTHGSPVNFSGVYYQAEFYGVNEHGYLDYDEIEKQALQLKPKVLIAGASAYARTIDFERFRKIADAAGAYLFVDMAHIAGLVATGLHPTPIPHAHVVSTTTHKTLRGPRGGLLLWNDESLSASLHKGVFPGTQGGPLEHMIVAKAVAFKEALAPDYKVYQKQVIANAKALAITLSENGLHLVSGGTDNHLVLLDLSAEECSGKDIEIALGAAGMTVNKNTVPGDKRSPFVTSGIRLGTPALTTRGMDEQAMQKIGLWIVEVIKVWDQPDALLKIREEVFKLAKAYPLYEEWMA
ncbi:MAG: serine hydroxymethyltransferase [Oligoflexales bacterium]